MMWCNISLANIVLNQCVEENPDGTLSKVSVGEVREFYINFEKGYVIFTHVKSDSDWELAKFLSENLQKDFPDINYPQPERSNSVAFTMTYADEKIITAKSDLGTKATHSHGVAEGTVRELYIKLDENIVEDNTIGVTEFAIKMVERGKKISEGLTTYPNDINHCKREDSSESDSDSSSGTAFFINNRGNLLTNNHVVEGCKLSKINYFNKEYDTNLISTDKTLDLALLKVDLKPKAFISFSNKEPRKRQLVIVAGYPLGEYLSDDLKINEGKISSLKGFENNSNEITVDLAINPGNSGGPIVNENGQLVAVAVAGMSKEVTEGISFGIKSSSVTNFLKTNKISPNIKLTSFSMNDEKVNQLLEESTVYIFCE